MPKLSLSLFLFFLWGFSLSADAQSSIKQLIEKADAVYDENPAQSMALYEKAELQADREGNHLFDGEIHHGKGRFYVLIGQYDAASAALNKAILIYTETKNDEGLASVYSIKSILLERIGESQQAHNMLLKALEIDKRVNNKSGMWSRYTNLSLDYFRSNQPDSMEYCLNETEKLLSKDRPKEFLYYYQNWGLYYTLLKDFNRAIQQYNVALEIAEEQKMTDSKATILVLLSKAYSNLSKLKLAEDYAQRSYVYSEENNLKYESAEALQELVNIYQAQGAYKKALEYQQKWLRIDKEINDLERLQKVKIIESQLNLAEKEKEIALAETALKEEQLQNQKTRTRNAWLVAGMLIVVVLLIFTTYIFYKTKKLNATIQAQKEEVEYKSLKLEDALMSIEDSLNYSKLIQESMLPSLDAFSTDFAETAVLYKPKDIVSGDFYWVNKVGDDLIFAVGDCTGHGVPGAMVSMVCFEALNKAVLESRLNQPADILHEVRKLVVKTFSNKDKSLNDGMDIAICKLSQNKLTYAGAHNPLWVCRTGEFDSELMNSEKIRIEKTSALNTSFLSVKASKQPIGKYAHQEPFDQSTIVLKKNDLIYLFSDGYVDQFGGDKGKKFKSSNFKDLLVKVKDQRLQNQKEELNNTFENWKGQLEQVDDICVLMLRV